MRLAAEVTRTHSGSGNVVPLHQPKFRGIALDDEPVSRIRGYGAANFATELFDRRQGGIVNRGSAKKGAGSWEV